MASMSTHAASSSSSFSFTSTPRRKYDVFLSFYGKDTRKGFTDHLYTALKQKGIIAFRDDEKLERGEFIDSGLLTAIEESKYAIVVLSLNYAFSKWCLIELAKIVQCMNEMGLVVLPVFYHVDPSHVRNQVGTFAEAFTQHEQDPRLVKEDVQTWRAAFQQVGKISGWHLQDGYESMVVENIIARIYKELNSQLPSDSQDRVGIELRVKEMMNVLDIGLNEVLFMGISGMGGVGKTTLASGICESIFYQFEASSFIFNVREEAEKHGLVYLQRKLLSDILVEREIINTWDDVRVSMEIRTRLSKRKVLITLDDVNEANQLEALVGSRAWFGLGSRIIVTGRDEQLLKAHGIENIYKAKGLHYDEALELFSWKAFKKPHPEDNYVGLSNDLVNYANGLPLALKVLGSSLFGRSTDAWKTAWNQLKANPDRKIFDILEIGFDRLGDIEKNLFLDIACFFKGENKDHIKDILESLGYSLKLNIDVLVDKSLISILGRKLWMHDLLQEMGQKIVRRESPEEPGRYSRLWLWEDAIRALKNEKGAGVVKGIVLNLAPPNEEHLNAEAFSNMEKLRLLKISNVHLPRGLNYLSNELRLIEWHGYPLKSLPRSFQPENLVKLNMHCSHIEQLWKGALNSDNLKYIDLSDSKNLIETPDFTGAPNLETLILQGCTSLYRVHPSIGVLKRLIILNLRGCKSLKNLPNNISLESLEIFDLSGCSRLEQFPEIVGNMTCLSKLYLDGTSLKKLPLSFESLRGLILLSLRDCEKLSIFPTAICSLSSLKTLSLSGCSRLDGMPENLKVMECLLFCSCFLPIERTGPINLLLPDSFSGLSSLISLDLSYCNLSDGTIPSDLIGLSSLQSLNLSGNKFTSIPDSICHLSSLISLDLSDCYLSDGAIPCDLRGLSALQSLNLRGNKFMSIPDSICQLSKLIELDLRNCRMLRSLPELPLSVLYVWAHGCISLETYSDKINVLTSNDAATIIASSTSVQHEGRIIHWIPASDTQFPLFLGRNLEAQIHHSHVLCFSSSAQTEIPEWFTIKSTNSSATMQLHLGLDGNSKWLGFAMFFVYNVREHENLNSWTPDLKDGHQFFCHFETDEGRLKQPLVLRIPRVPSELIGIWVYVPHAWFSRRSNNLDKWSFIEASVTTGSLGVDVKKFGVHLLNEQDALEFVANVRRCSLGGLHNDGNSSYYKFENFISNLPTSVGEAECSSKDSNSNSIPFRVSVEDKGSKVDLIIQLKGDLQNLLSKCFEVNYAKNKIYKYIFPQGASQLSPWFTTYSFANNANIYLPPNLYDDKSWIGFSVYACCALQGHASGDNRYSKIYRNFYCVLDTKDDCLQPLVIFPLTKDLFVESHRLVVFHIPRVFFTHKLNQQTWIRAQFGCDSVEFQMCGIRLVYEQDLEEFVETIVDYTFRSPDVYYQGYYQRLLDQVENLSSYVHEVESREPLEEKQNSTSLETLSGQATARGASRYSTFNVVQNRFDEHHDYNVCFPECEVPEWFYHCNGPSMEIPLHPDLYSNSDWKGIALCAAFEVLKHPNLIHDNLGSEISHGLSCYVGSDVGWAMVLRHIITETEFNKSIWLNQRRFIWILYIPRGSSLDKLEKCNLVKVLFGSESKDLMVQKCGCRLVHQQNVEEFVQTIVQCSTTSPGNSHQFLADDEKKTSGIGSSNEKLATKCRRFLEELFEDHPFDPFNYCFPPSFPPSEILELFSSLSTGPSVTMELLGNDLNWKAIALCASFSVQDYPMELLNNLEDEIPHHLNCLFETDIDSLRPLHVYRTTKEEFKWSRLGGFIWLSYIPYWCLSDKMHQCNRIKASVVSDWPGITVRKCGLRLVHQQDEKDIGQIMFHCAVSFLDNWDLFRRDVARQDCTPPVTFSNHVKEHISMDPGFTSNASPISADNQGCQSDSTTQINRCFKEFDLYSKRDLILFQIEIPKWFNHPIRGPSVAIQLPPNFYNDDNWKGLALCASFSVDEHKTLIGDHLDSDVSHNLICQLNTEEFYLEPRIDYHITGKRFILLFQLSGFVWLTYIPRKLLPNGLSQYSLVGASFQSDSPRLTVQNCGLRLLYDQDVQAFDQTIEECFTSGAYNNIDLILQFTEEDAKKIKQNKNSTTLIKRNPKVFHPNAINNIGLPQIEIPKWFSHQSSGPSVAIQLPPNLYNVNDWKGLALCASFSEDEQHKTLMGDHLDSDVSHSFTCQLTADKRCLQPHIDYCITGKRFMLLFLRGFVWLSYIPRSSLSNLLSDCSQIEASFLSDCSGLTVHNCGLHLLYDQDVQQFDQTIIESYEPAYYNNLDLVGQLAEDEARNDERNKKTGGSFKDPYPERFERPIFQGQSSGGGILCEDQHPESQLFKCGPLVFDRCVVHNFCFPPIEVLEWFSHHNNEPSMTTDLPPGFYDNSNWIGLALCASFVAHEHPSVILDTMDSKTSHHLICCHLKTDIGREHPHVYCPNKEELELLHLGGFIWLSYIPRGSLPNWLSRCSHIGASIFSDCPNLTATKYGLRLVYRHDEVKFEQTIRHCMNSLSDNWDLIGRSLIDNRKRNEESSPKLLRGSVDPMLKDKGKQVLE